MQVMNQEALRNAAAAAGNSTAAAAAAAYSNAAANAAAAGGGYNSQHWAAMLNGFTNGLTNNRNTSSTTTPTQNNALNAPPSDLHHHPITCSSSPPSPQNSSPPASSFAFQAKNSMIASPSMVPLGPSNIPQILNSNSPQHGGITNMYEPPAIRIGSGRGRGSGGRKVHQLIGENGRPFVKCDMCGKCLADPSSLYRHRKIHSGEKPHTCRFCGRKFIQRYLWLRLLVVIETFHIKRTDRTRQDDF